MITSQLRVCPIPFRYDTYTGCTHGCKYCFARNTTEFSRTRHGVDKPSFSNIEGSNPEKLKLYLEKIFNSNIYNNSNYSEHVALKERIPIKIGASSDPFPGVELHEKITYDTLKIFDEYDYPLQILTKNPVILSKYINDFDNPNWAISCSLISTDDKLLKKLEPGAPTPDERFNAIKSITDRGYHVMIKVQPAILPIVINDLPKIVERGKDSGIWAFNTEGLKMSALITPNELKRWDEIGSILRYDIHSYYKYHFRISKEHDIEPYLQDKLEYIKLSVNLSNQYNLKYFVADNDIGNVGNGPECCGTENLRDYKIWGGCNRVGFFGGSDKSSKEFGESYYNKPFGYKNKRRYKVKNFETGMKLNNFV